MAIPKTNGCRHRHGNTTLVVGMNWRLLLVKGVCSLGCFPSFVIVPSCVNIILEFLFMFLTCKNNASDCILQEFVERKLGAHQPVKQYTISKLTSFNVRTRKRLDHPD